MHIELDDHEQAKGVSEQASRVLFIAERTLELFLEKNRGYGPTSEHLGAKGCYSDIYRKVGKLKHTLWDGNDSVGESVIEMLQDLVGHSLLAIDFLQREQDKTIG